MLPIARANGWRLRCPNEKLPSRMGAGPVAGRLLGPRRCLYPSFDALQERRKFMVDRPRIPLNQVNRMAKTRIPETHVEAGVADPESAR